MSGAGSCRLRVTRAGGYADYLRSYTIIVNGKEVGTIGRNSTAEFVVPSGRLTVEASVDWGRSTPIEIDARPDQTVALEVSNRWGALLALWAITFGSGSYLQLRQL
jgi:hypothetical protein